ncbi:MAG: C45 family autoproteolytic acyltransferase/hydrolase [Bacteroidota bacterium]
METNKTRKGLEIKVKKIAGIALLIAGVAIMLLGCHKSDNSPVNNPVSIKKMENYYNVTLDYSNCSHREMGRQFALSIKQVMPEYEATIDFLLAMHMVLLENAPNPLTFNTVKERAKIIYENLNNDYKEEIAGMLDVFNYDVDKLVDGRLSKNEFIIYQMFSEVMRPNSCSASAAIGSASATGSTIVARNWDWLSMARYGIAHLHSITTYKNGSKTITNMGPMGQLNGLTLFNQHHLFGAVINSTTGALYPTDLSNRRSFFFDLRYAFENFSTLAQVSDYMKDANKLYLYNHLILLADQATAGVVENQVNNKQGGAPGNRSFRTESSTLNPLLTMGQTWGIPGIFAAVNDYRLPNNDWDSTNLENTTRWTSFREKYAGVASGQRIDIETLKSITGYPGPNSNGKMTDGAIFNSEMQQLWDTTYPIPAFNVGAGLPGISKAYTTMQSVIMDMKTMELWIHFVPPTYFGERPPLRPTYQKIPNPIY